MVIAVATFLGAAALFLGIYWILMVRPERSAHTDLQKRLKGRIRKSALLKITRERERLSEIAWLDRLLTRLTSLSRPIGRAIEESDLRTSVGTLILLSGCVGLVVYLTVIWTLHLVWVGALAGLLASMVPYAYVQRVRRKRIAKLEEQFPEAIDLIGRALRAGHAFTTGLGMVADEMPEPTRGEFRLLYDRQNYGMSLPEAMRAFADRVPLLDARFFVTAVLTQREAGGNLAEVLDNLARVIRDRFKVKRQIRVVTAHGRLTGGILVAMPPCLAVLFLIVVPDSTKILISDPLGVRMVVGAALMQVLGTLIIRKIVDIEY
jgi:tight adherence protein B